MSFLDITVLVLSIASTYCYLCRVDLLRVGKHRFDVILMHVAFGVASIMAGHSAIEGKTSPIDVAAVIGALLWIKISWWSWKGSKVPKQFQTGPADLDSKPIERTFE